MARARRAEAEAWGPPVDNPTVDVLVPTSRLQLDQLAAYFGEGRVRVGLFPGQSFVAYEGRFAIPREFSVMFDPGPPAPKVFLRVVVDERKRAEVSEVQVLRRPDGPSIGGSALRDIPVDTILREAMEEAAHELVTGEDGKPEVVRVKDRQGAADDLFAAYHEETGKPARQGVPVTDSRLREVAEHYRVAATAKRGAPKKAIAKRFHVSESTASRWIRMARERGFLGKARQGRAGEFSTKEESDA